MAAETLEIQLQLKLDQIAQGLAKIEQSFGGIGDKGGKKISSDLANSVDGRKAGEKISKELTGSAGEAGTSFGKMFGANLVANLAASGIQNAISGIFSGASSGFNAFVGFEDSMAGITKTAGLTKEETKAMGDEILKLAPTTRSSIDELQKLAQIGGAFGVPKQELAGFTTEINKVNVALGDEFSGGAEEVGKSLATLKNLFSETKDTGFAESMTKIGSTLNELGASGTATGPVVAEFANRIGQLGPALSPSITETLGLGAAFQELGLSAEISSSGLSNILLTAGTKSEQFAQQIGISTQAFQEMLKNSPNEALLQLAKSFEGVADDPTKLAEAMKGLGLSSQESVKVMSLLATKTDLVREKQELASKSFQEATSIQKEYDTVNSTTAANMAKAGNLIQVSAIKIGDSLKTAFENNPALQKFSQKFAEITEQISKINFQPLADGVANTVGFIVDNIGLVGSALAGIGAGFAITSLISGFTALTAPVTLATGVVTTFGATLLTALWPVVAIVTGVALAASALYLAWQTNFGGIQEIAMNVFNNILLPAFNQLKTAFDQLIPALQRLWDVVSPVLLPVLQTLGVVLGVVIVGAILILVGVITGIVTAMTWFADTVTNAVNTAKQKWGEFSSFLSSSWETIKQIWDTGVNAISAVWNAVWDSIKAFVGAVFLSLVDIFTTGGANLGQIWGAFGEKLKSIWGEIWEWIKMGLGLAWDWISGKFNELVQWGSDKMNEAKDGITKAWDDAWNYVKSIDVGQIAKDLLNGFINGIKNGAAGVVDAMKDMANNAVKAAKEALQIHSPSRVMMEVGMNTTAGMTLGIEKGTDSAAKAALAMANSVINSATNGIGTALFGTAPILPPVATAVTPATTIKPPVTTTPAPQTSQQPSQDENIMQTANEGIDKQNEGVDDMITKISEQLPEAYNIATDKIKEALANMESVVVEMANAINENFIGIFTGMGQNIPTGIVFGMAQKERLAYQAIGNLEDNVLRAVGEEIASRDRFGEDGRGAANNVPSVVSAIGEFARNFQASGGGQGNTTNKSVNIGGNVNINNNSERDALGQLANAFL